MIFHVSESNHLFNGVFKSTGYHPIRTNASVNKISSIKATAQNTSSVIREAEQAYVAENTPSYNIRISSQGKAAIDALNAFRKSNEELMNSLLNERDSRNTQNLQNTQSNQNAQTANADSRGLGLNDSKDDLRSNNPGDSPNANSSRVNPGNLASYTENQLRGLVSDGSITRSDMDKELDKRVTTEDDSSESVASAVFGESEESSVQVASSLATESSGTEFLSYGILGNQELNAEHQQVADTANDLQNNSDNNITNASTPVAGQAIRQAISAYRYQVNYMENAMLAY